MELSGAWNFRDVAEQTGVRPGLLYRASELSKLTDEGGRRLVELGIANVADLRSHREVQRRGPGHVPSGVEIHLLPFHFDDDSEQDAPHESTFQRVMSESPADEDVTESAKRYMAEVYEEFPALPGAQTAVRQVISLLADGKPVLAHCFAGKDRTGFTVATVLEAVGVDRDAIVGDFLRSNDAIPALRERILEQVRARAGEAAEVITFAEARLTDEVLGVRAEYLEAAWRVRDEKYGSLGGFLDVAEVTHEQRDRLRAALRA
ncbi:phosphotyrosine protein phosphatase PtpB [Mycolicibacterium canariasense]|uniref:Phosphotyrosine protein phosphatase PtpB n=1 Tax=Mycolicibacterium canariasense TaxID=228230 RepID=A0A100WKV8_MYCCR|nr:tyrosine-protein phosphatase [Mycolicibacterium canariasense]MCV7207676.1 tyrosine-protein phosphatase [Mycolicibacterium canariasense]ORV08888.1 phosphotyrosine protein phosphatase [Mycolicibacterium canariasense]GAS99789.1 phosphotyrosine protein phosphatase PtpB [Mycolicibacterium canariasense]